MLLDGVIALCRLAGGEVGLREGLPGVFTGALRARKKPLTAVEEGRSVHQVFVSEDMAVGLDVVVIKVVT